MNIDDLQKQSQDQLTALSDLVLKQNESIMNQRSSLIEQMQQQLGALHPMPKAVDPFVEIVDRLDKIESDLADLRKDERTRWPGGQEITSEMLINLDELKGKQ